MSKSSPPLSIGLPVYNGENFLEQSLDCLLGQTYGDFELIISDNASTDRTAEICGAYAGQDSRIRYFRQKENLGAADNYNFVFDQSAGRFFKWATHDDLLAPTFLERCVEILKNKDCVVLVFTLGQDIDENGNIIRTYPPRNDTDDLNQVQRFRSMVTGRQPVIPIFGVMRRETLAKTRLIGKYTGSDRPLIGEMALRGKIYEVPEYLFFYRVHPEQSWSNKNRRAQQSWYDPERAGKRTFPSWRLLLEHEWAIWRVPMGLNQRIRLQGVIARWVRTRWRLLAGDLSGKG
jgi:glycosyltransferase involved in cell wall biosynthesis